MRYEEPNMDILEIKTDDVVTSSLNGGTIGTDDGYQMPEGW